MRKSYSSRVRSEKVRSEKLRGIWIANKKKRKRIR